MADLIDRQAAIDALEDKYMSFGIFREQRAASQCIDVIKNLPSAQPERKRGRWIDTDRGEINISKVYCSICMKEYIPRQWMSWKYGETPKNFCPNCGAEMIGETNVE